MYLISYIQQKVLFGIHCIYYFNQIGSEPLNMKHHVKDFHLDNETMRTKLYNERLHFLVETIFQGLRFLSWFWLLLTKKTGNQEFQVISFDNFKDDITSKLTVMKCLFHWWRRTCFYCRKNNSVILFQKWVARRIQHVDPDNI